MKCYLCGLQSNLLVPFFLMESLGVKDPQNTSFGGVEGAEGGGGNVRGTLRPGGLSAGPSCLNSEKCIFGK